MTSQLQVPKKDDVHQRLRAQQMYRPLIKKHSKTYKKLLAAKLLDDVPSTPQENVILETESKEPTTKAKTIQGKMNKHIQKNKVLTRRGTKVLKATRRPTRQETIDKVSDYAIKSPVDIYGPGEDTRNMFVTWTTIRFMDPD